jgi:hypothetical protein
MKNGFFHLMLICISGLICLTKISAQENQIVNHDYLMPQKGTSMIGLYSGIPYVGIAEYSYGFSNRFSAGILLGFTPAVEGYGFRIKAIIAQPSDATRIILKSPFFYYPKTKELGGDPWVLTWPTLNIEWHRKNGSRVWTGIGIVGAECADMLFGSIEDNKKSMTSDGTVMMKKKGFMSDYWYTFQIGYAKCISNKLSYMFEVAPVMKGLKFATSQNWVGGPPVILTFGLSYKI